MEGCGILFGKRGGIIIDCMLRPAAWEIVANSESAGIVVSVSRIFLPV